MEISLRVREFFSKINHFVEKIPESALPILYHKKEDIKLKLKERGFDDNNIKNVLKMSNLPDL